MTDTTPITEDLVLVRHPHAVFRGYDGETVILLPSAQTEARVLNEVGGRVWSLLDGRRDVAAIVAEVVREFDVASEEASADVRDFLAELMDRGLVQPGS